MADISNFDVNIVGNPNNNIFGLPFTEEESRLIILPVPWEVTVSYGAGTSRAPEQIFTASMQVDLFDPVDADSWKAGIFMRSPDKKLMSKSDYLRKEAELFIDFVSQGEDINSNKFMCKSLREINEGSQYLNNWVYEQTSDLLKANKLVALLGGDHSTPLGFWKALAEKHGPFGILQIDAHCDLRESYEHFTYSHASVTYNGLKEIENLERVVLLGIRDYSQGEWAFIQANPERIVVFRDMELKRRQYDGEFWRDICDDIISQLPQKVHISFDIDGLDPKLCPHTGTPVHGGFEADQINYLLNRLAKTNRQIIGFDLVEIGAGDSNWDANVGARELWRLCNLLLQSHGN
jgi:agmatinase